jgi:uncharacterized membrane protein
MIPDITDLTKMTGFLFDNPDYLYLIIPVLIVGGYYLKKSKKKLLVLSRIVVAALIVVALAAPYNLSTHTITDTEPSITVIDDQSVSMRMFNASSADAVYELIHARNPTAQFRSFTGDQSPIGDKIMQYARGGDHIVLVSDGNSNYGRELADAISVVAKTNTTVYAIEQAPDHNDMSVEIVGSKNVIIGNRNTFGIVVRMSGTTAKCELTVKVDDATVYQSTINQNERLKVMKIPHTFETLGSHAVTARIAPGGGDHFSENNIFHKSVHVVPKPDVLLVTGEESNLRDIVSSLYNTSVSTHPGEFSKTKAVILDNRYIESMTPDVVEKLRDFVSMGGGLIVLGGDKSYDRGGYLDSDFERILPVKSYPSEYYGRNDVVIVMDISASMLSDIVSGNGVSFLDYEKALIIDILDDDEFRDDRVGVAAFGGKAYVIAGLRYLGNDPTREALQETVMSISPQGQMSTPLEAGLTMAGEMLANSAGAKDVIILSDGNKIDYASSLAIATEMQENGIRMHFIHVMSSPTSSQTKYEEIARAVDASYAQTTYPKSINIETGQPEAEPTPTPTQTPDTPGAYTVRTFTTKHFITEYLNLSGVITGYNDVTPKLGAKRLVVTDEGKPVVCTWRYGLGRVVAFTTDNGNEWSSSLYSGNNSNLISAVVNWAIGDPRPETGILIEADDLFLGEACDVTIVSDTIPNLIFGGSALDVSRVSEKTYRTEIDLAKEGVYYLSDYGIAVNYPLEYLETGMNPDLAKIIQSHGGKVYSESEITMLLSDVRRRSERTVYTPVSQKIPFIVAALALFLIEVLLRRVRDIMKSRSG